MVSGIYCIRNTVDGKMYIGRSTNLAKREKTHFWMLKKNRHFNVHLQRAYNLNPDVFKFEILEECAKDLLNDKEVFYISKYKTMDMEHGYNLCEGGKATTGRKFSEETLKKMSEKRKGYKYSKEVIEKRKQSLKEHLASDPEFARQYHEKMSQNIKNIPSWKKSHPCPEWRKKEISEFFKGRKITDEHKQKLRELYSGEGSLSAKLTQSEVIEMRLRFLNGEPRMSIAKDFPNMHPNTIYDIVKGKRWKCLPNSIEELERIKYGTKIYANAEH